MKDVRDDLIGLTISIPSSYKIFPRELYEELKIDKRTFFLFLTDNDKYISFMYQCKLKEEDFLNLYIDNIKTLKSEGMNVIYEGGLKTSGKLKTVKYAFVELETNGKKIRIMQNFFLYNEYFINVSTEVNPNIDPKNILSLMDDSDVTMLLKIILSIK